MYLDIGLDRIIDPTTNSSFSGSVEISIRIMDLYLCLIGRLSRLEFVKSVRRLGWEVGRVLKLRK